MATLVSGPTAHGSFLQFLNFDIQDLSPLANRHQASQRGSAIQEVCDSFSVDRKLPLRRPGQKFCSFWVWLVVRSRDRATPSTM